MSYGTENRYRSFLRVREDYFFRRCNLVFPRYLGCVSLLGCPTGYFVQRRSSLRAEWGSAPNPARALPLTRWGSAPVPARALPLTRQGLPRPWMGGMRSAVFPPTLFVPLTIILPRTPCRLLCLSCPRRTVILPLAAASTPHSPLSCAAVSPVCRR